MLTTYGEAQKLSAELLGGDKRAYACLDVGSVPKADGHPVCDLVAVDHRVVEEGVNLLGAVVEIVGWEGAGDVESVHGRYHPP